MSATWNLDFYIKLYYCLSYVDNNMAGTPPHYQLNIYICMCQETCVQMLITTRVIDLNAKSATVQEPMDTI